MLRAPRAAPAHSPPPSRACLLPQDVLLSALLRNFILAGRVLWHLQCTVVSSPTLPDAHAHPLWAVWDHTVDLCLAQLRPAAAATVSYTLTPFFTDQARRTHSR